MKKISQLTVSTLALLAIGQATTVAAASILNGSSDVTVAFGQDQDTPHKPTDPNVPNPGETTDPTTETEEENQNVNGTGDLTFTQLPKIFDFGTDHLISGTGFTGANALSALDNGAAGGSQTVQVYDGRIGYNSGWKVTARLGDLSYSSSKLTGAAIVFPAGQLSNKWYGNSQVGTNLEGAFSGGITTDVIVGSQEVTITAGGADVEFLEAVDAKTLGVVGTSDDGTELAALSDADKKLLGYSYTSRFWDPTAVKLDVPTIPTKGTYTGVVNWTLQATATF
ncbi:MAG: WxL domain-containing protein [Streptococcaceae bacterium]|jgi:hypothetical protein|nr:WxL domain-containing protein [Streptococcaceae bacterium]